MTLIPHPSALIPLLIPVSQFTLGQQRARQAFGNQQRIVAERRPQLPQHVGLMGRARLPFDLGLEVGGGQGARGIDCERLRLAQVFFHFGAQRGVSQHFVERGFRLRIVRRP
ncbi:MAG: hypothetical protein ACREEM_44410 [Blastocatellia bacterium]